MGLDPQENKPSASQPLSGEEKKKLCELARYFSRAVSMAHDFGISHPLVKQPIEQFFSLLSIFLQQKPSIILYIAESKLRYGDTVLEENNPVVDKLITLFSAIKLVSVEFQRDFSHNDLINLLSVMAMRAQDIAAGGGIEKLASEKNIAHLKINPIKYELIGQDEKVVSEGAKLAEDDLEELEKKLAQWESNKETPVAPPEEPRPEKDEERRADELLSLIDPVLKEDADLSIFTERLSKDPLAEVNAIIAAIHLVNRVGGQKAVAFVSSINKKLNFVRDGLYQCLIEGKEDDATKQLYTAAAVLGKELPPQIKAIEVGDELRPLIVEMTEVLGMITDQTEARKLLVWFLKGEMTLKKKAGLLKKINQHQKSSPDFEFMIKNLLVLKGLSEEEVKRLLEEKESILELAQKEKPAALTPSVVKKIQEENKKLLAQTQVFNAAFGDIDEGVLVLDEDDRVVFINPAAQQILSLNTEDKIDKQLADIFKDWPQNKDVSGQEERLKKIISCIKTIKKDQSGQLKSVIFKTI